MYMYIITLLIDFFFIFVTQRIHQLLEFSLFNCLHLCFIVILTGREGERGGKRRGKRGGEERGKRGGEGRIDERRRNERERE